MAAPDVEYRCFVGGLAWVTDDSSLEKTFRQYGEVVESKIINDRETGRSRGFGFVTFANEQSMRDAIEGLNGQSLDGRNITVNEAQSRGSGGGGGGYHGEGQRLDAGYGGSGYIAKVEVDMVGDAIAGTVVDLAIPAEVGHRTVIGGTELQALIPYHFLSNRNLSIYLCIFSSLVVR